MSNRAETFKPKWTPTWELLSLLGKNRIVKSSYIWFFLIPILAKSIGKFKRLVSEGQLSSDWIKFLDSILALPFEWKFLYFSSVFFALATLLYAIFCPKLLQKFSNWNEAEQEGCGVDTLVYFYSNWLRGNGKIKDGSGATINPRQAVKEIVDSYCKKLSVESDNQKPWEQISGIELRSDCQPKQLFLIMSRQMIRDKTLIRWLISLLYVLGGILLLYVLFNNFMSVILA